MKRVNMRIFALSCLMALALSSCDKENKKSNVAERVDPSKPKITQEVKKEEIERLRDYVYEVSELSSINSESEYLFDITKEDPKTSIGFVFVRGILDKYESYGYNEDKYIDKRDDSEYKATMYIKDVNDGSTIKAYLGSYGKHAYVMGDTFDIVDLVGKEIVIYGYLRGDYLGNSNVVLSSEVDSLYENKMKDLENFKNIKSEDFIEEFLNSDRLEFYRKYHYHNINIEGIINDTSISDYFLGNAYTSPAIETILHRFDDSSYDKGDMFKGKGRVEFSPYNVDDDTDDRILIRMYIPGDEEEGLYVIDD